MTFQLILRSSSLPSASPYRLLDGQGRELAWANAFLDAQRLRQLSLRSLRAYGYDLLPKPAPSTVNHRLAVLGCLYHFHYGCEIPGSKAHFHRSYTTRSPLGYGRPRRRVTTALRLRQPRCLVVPLSADQVADFWKSFRTFRDLAIVALMLLDGLRSCEVLQLQLEDLSFSEAHLCVLGKGNKKRLLPLPAEIIEVLQNYLRCERPLTSSPFLFVSWKGRRRGLPMTAAGLRSLFRHHRLSSK